MIKAIFISPEHGAAQTEAQSIQLTAGMGIQGDRNYGKSDHPGQNITLIESEIITAFNQQFSQAITLSAPRRNLITEGVRLNELVDKEFSIGDVRFRGVELCEPCSFLGDLLANDTISKREVIKAFIHKGGLRADILNNGEITAGMRLST